MLYPLAVKKCVQKKMIILLTQNFIPLHQRAKPRQNLWDDMSLFENKLSY